MHSAEEEMLAKLLTNNLVFEATYSLESSFLIAESKSSTTGD